MRSLWPLLLSSVIGCSSSARPFDGSEAAANLRAQAAHVEHAMIQEDHQQMTDLTHVSLVSHFGGRTGYVRWLEATAADLRRQGLKFRGFRFGSPSRMFESAGDLYAIYPYSLELTGPNGEPASQPSYLVCTSPDGGATWKFLDGAGVGSDRGKLTRFLPGFPAELILPEPGPLVVDQ
jgi:hypothetical protein